MRFRGNLTDCAIQKGKHFPVMLPEVLLALSPQKGETYIDATFGGGSYSRAILNAADCNVIGLDRDPLAIERGRKLESEFANKFKIIESTFSKIDELNFPQVDGIVFDIGVSSFQIDDAARGFSFMRDGPLDMRMGGDVPSAAEIIATFDAEQLANIFWKYGEEKNSRKIARAIVHDRQEKPFTTTLQLAGLIERLSGFGREKIHPATRVFQALRIYVNDELGELEKALLGAEKLLKPNGRLVVVSFHSLEDRIVKNFIHERAMKERGSRYFPDAQIRPTSFEISRKKAVLPSANEVAINPRSRSAKLRMAIRTAAPAFS
jgi:16S rRNA (cytosine1402-N4)-methyltransferase